MSVKITLPAEPTEDDVFPWLYRCGVGRPNAWFFSGPEFVGHCVWAKSGMPGSEGRVLGERGYVFTRLTRAEIEEIGLSALIPPAKLKDDKFHYNVKPTAPNYWASPEGGVFVITSEDRAVALGRTKDGRAGYGTGGSVYTAGIALKPLPQGTIIEITVE